MKRILLFLGTNIAVVLVLSIVTSVLGVNRWFTANGLNYEALLIFCAVFGFGGAFISLAISKPIAKWSTGAKLITQPRNSAEAWLLSTVQRQARQAGIGMPEVAVFDSPVPNAFATGASKNKALVAVSSGLMKAMSQDEVEAVLGHEISHVANGDMVTLTLIQGVVNTFVMFLARVVAARTARASAWVTTCA
jgi:heat shock protein HtpX